jgi:hypothetical protein
MKQLFVLLLCCCSLTIRAQRLYTPFEGSVGLCSATYEECMNFYETLKRQTGNIRIDTAGPTDAGLLLRTIVYPADMSDAMRAKAITILINNGIHPGEPDGIDASMMLLRDAAEGRITLPENVQLVVIPIYNIGGALNRNNNTRVNQNGPMEYGFRGNSQNLDLNRDFTKRDASESRTFARLFHTYDPAIFIDNHVSDGADYQHTMTLVSTQYDKLGGKLGKYFRTHLDSILYHNMETAGWPMSPYVHTEETPERGWTAFYDPPRFSSGYVAMFNTIAWVPETHMLKPFDQRVRSTYTLMKEIITLASQEAEKIKSLRKEDRRSVAKQQYFPLEWVDSAATIWPFRGYTPAFKPSDVTGVTRLYYNHAHPRYLSVPIRDHYAPRHFVKAPEAYLIPRAYHEVAERLLDNQMLFPWFSRLERDTMIDVTAYYIDSFKTTPTPYEKHYKHSSIHASPVRMRVRAFEGDYIFNLSNNPFKRYLVEMLEPEGEDSYFAWNFFDGILQRKEGYSDYRWEDVAAEELYRNPDLKAALAAEKKANPALAKDPAAQLFYVYRHSRWYESTHNRYPVYRLE